MKERNYGIDLLRMVSMLMVIVLHLLRFGGIYNPESAGLNRGVVSVIDTCCICAVNCFAIISGFVGHKSKFRLSNLIHLWFIVTFYLGTLSIVFCFFPGVHVCFSDIITSFFPVLFNKHWYVTAYFGMFFFIPILNIGISKLTDKQLRIITIALLIVFSVMSTVANFFSDNSLFELAFGYSPIWLMICYILGAFLKRCGNTFFSKHVLRNWFLIYVFGIVLTLGLKLLIDLLSRKLLLNNSGGELYCYNSPTVLLSAIGLVMFFAKLDIKRSAFVRFISTFSPMAFSVCVIHTQKQFSEVFIKDRFVFVSNLNPILIPIVVLVIAITIYSICTGIDCVRTLIFKKAKVRNLSIIIDNSIRILVNK